MTFVGKMVNMLKYFLLVIVGSSFSVLNQALFLYFDLLFKFIIMCVFEGMDRGFDSQFPPLRLQFLGNGPKPLLCPLLSIQFFDFNSPFCSRFPFHIPDILKIILVFQAHKFTNKINFQINNARRTTKLI